MGQRLEKNMKILDELVSYCAKRGARNVDMNINLMENSTTLTVSAPNTTITDYDLLTLKEALECDRQHEVEECYWCISGEDNFGDELALAGVMIDSADITYDGDRLTIIAKRIED